MRDTLQVGDTIQYDQGTTRIYDASETTLVFRTKDTLVGVIWNKNEAKDLQGFQEFLDSNTSFSSVEHFVKLADITGDGEPDSCLVQVTFTGGGMFAEARIISKGEQIWYDSCGIDQFQAGFHLWCEDEESYAALMPYSTHFVAPHSFIGDKIDTSRGMFDNFRNFLEANPNDSTRWRMYFAHHDVLPVWTIGPIGNGEMIWDEKTHQFICYACE